MIAVNSPLLRYALIFSPSATSWGKGKKPCAGIDPSFYKKKRISLDYLSQYYTESQVSEIMWCMAILEVRVMGYGHYRDEKFPFF